MTYHTATLSPTPSTKPGFRPPRKRSRCLEHIESTGPTLATSTHLDRSLRKEYYRFWKQRYSLFQYSLTLHLNPLYSNGPLRLIEEGYMMGGLMQESSLYLRHHTMSQSCPIRVRPLRIRKFDSQQLPSTPFSSNDPYSPTFSWTFIPSIRDQATPTSALLDLLPKNHPNNDARPSFFSTLHKSAPQAKNVVYGSTAKTDRSADERVAPIYPLAFMPTLW